MESPWRKRWKGKPRFGGKSESPASHSQTNQGGNGSGDSDRVRPGEKRILIGEASVLKGSPSVLCLPHPRTRQSASFLVDADRTTIREMITFAEENRCWFIGDTVESNGKVYFAAHVDPVLLVLPFLRAAERPQPIEQVLVDADFPNLSVLAAPAFTKNLDRVAAKKGAADLRVWQFDEQKALEYLAVKVQRVSNSLLEDRVSVEGGATSGQYVKTLNKAADKVAYLRYAHGLVSDYLEQDMSEKLKVHLQVPDEEKAAPKKRASTDEAISANKRQKKATGDNEPEEDYSKEYAKKLGKAKESPQNAKQRALAKSAEGSKNIASFFKKKT